MGFSESVKLNVKRKANFTCCWCQDRRNKVEVHHIVPQVKGGADDEENAAPLCGSCHGLYGGNPELRKEIRQRRDHWYDICSKTLGPNQPWTRVSDLTVKVSELLAKVQSRSVPLSQCIAEALTVAQKANNRSFETFCRNELSGWSSKVEKQADFPSFRLVEVFVSATARINLQSFAWGENVNGVFEYMRQETEHFHPRTFALLYPVSEIESEQNPDPRKAVRTIELKVGHINPDAKYPDVPVVGYARADIFQTILESIRQELTNRLLDMIPRVEGDSLPR